MWILLRFKRSLCALLSSSVDPFVSPFAGGSAVEGEIMFEESPMNFGGPSPMNFGTVTTCKMTREELQRLFATILLTLCLSLLMLDRGSLLASAAVVSCTAVEDGITSTVDLTQFRDPKSFLVEFANCSWTNADVTFDFASPTHVVFRGVATVGGSIVLAPLQDNFSPFEGSSLEVYGCTVTNARHAFRIDVLGTKSSVKNFDVAFRDSTITATSSVLQFATSKAENVTVVLVSSSLTVVSDLSSAFIGSIGRIDSSENTQVFTNVTINVYDTRIDAKDMGSSSPVVCIGGGWTAALNVTLKDVRLVVNGSFISCSNTGGGTAVSVGIAAISFGNSTRGSDSSRVRLTASGISLRGHASNISAAGGDVSVSLGIVLSSNTSSAAGVFTGSTIEMFAAQSNISSVSDGGCSASLGIVSVSADDASPAASVHIVNTTAFALGSEVSARVGQGCAAALAVASGGAVVDTSIDNSAFISVESTVEAVCEYQTVAALGIAAASSALSLTNVTLYASGSKLAAQSDCVSSGATTAAAVAVGVSSGGETSADGLAMYVCSSTASASVCAVDSIAIGSSGKPLVLAQWFIRGVEAAASVCLDVLPTTDGTNVMSNVYFVCAKVGWGNSAVGRHYAKGVFVNGTECGDACMSNTFSGALDDEGSSERFNDKCSQHFALPRFSVPAVPQLPRPIGTKSASQSMTVANAHWSQSLSPSPSHSASAPPLTQSPSHTDSQTAWGLTASELPSYSATPSLGKEGVDTSNNDSVSVTLQLVPLDNETTFQFSTTTAVGEQTTSSPPDDSNSSTQDDVNPAAGPVAVALGLLVAPRTASVIGTAAPLSTVGSALASPTAASQFSRLAAGVRLATCTAASSSIDQDATIVEHPLQFNLGGGKLQSHCGACISDLIVVCAFSALQFLQLNFIKRGDASKFVLRCMKVVGLASAVISAYFLPNMVGSASVLLFAPEGLPVELTVGIVTLVGWAALLAWPLVVTVRLAVHVKWTSITKHDTTEFRYESLVATAPFVETFFGYFDDARDPNLAYCRLVYFEEVLSASICSFIAGMRSTSNCKPLLIAEICVCGVHLLFTVATRPYCRKINTAFSVVSAVTAVGVCALGFAVMSDAEQRASWIAYPLLLQSVVFFIQALVAGVRAFVMSSKRKVEKAQKEASGFSGGIDDDDDVVNPLLTDADGSPIFIQCTEEGEPRAAVPPPPPKRARMHVAVDDTELLPLPVPKRELQRASSFSHSHRRKETNHTSARDRSRWTMGKATSALRPKSVRQ